MPAQATYDSIATFTADGSSQSIIFSNIPQTYTDLAIAVSLRSTNASSSDSWQVQVNATSSIYSDTWLRTDGSSVTSIRNTSTFGCVVGNCPAASATANIYNAGTVEILNYRSSVFKSLVSRSASDANGSGWAVNTGGLIRTTSAITRLDVFTSSANMAAGSIVTLYGITAA